jgi:hypothetical protein
MRTGFAPATFRRGIPRAASASGSTLPVRQLPYHRLVNPDPRCGAARVSHNLQSDLGLTQMFRAVADGS